MRDAANPLEATGWREPVVFGFSPLAASALLERLWEADAPCLPGDFVLHARHEDGEHELLASSLMSARPYYVCPTSGGAIHGPDLHELLARARLPWRWNRRAVHDLLVYDHPSGTDTLHGDVLRIPANALTLLGPDGVRFLPRSYWSGAAPGSSDVARLTDNFKSAYRATVPDGAVLSLSGGLDSRLLLAAALAEGHTPRLLTVGYTDSADRIVAERIAVKERLALESVELDEQSYLENGRTIARLTGGSKLVSSWHTYLYTKQGIGDRSIPHGIGSNGELVRSFYLDRGRASSTLDRLGPPGLLAFLCAKGLRRRDDLRHLRTGKELAVVPRQALRLMRHTGRGPASDRLATLYATQRVRHFIGNGIALYAAHSDPRAPMLDASWVEAARALPPELRVGSRWHRRAIGALWPRLMDHPVGEEASLATDPPRRYWRRDPEIPYNPASAVLRSAAVTDVLRQSPVVRELAAGDQRHAHRWSERSRDVLLTLHNAAMAATDA